MNTNLKKIQDLIKHYLNLLKIIEVYGKGKIDAQIYRIKDIIDYLNSKKHDNDQAFKAMQFIIKNNHFLYPPRGGLTDFEICLDTDKDKEKQLNILLEDIQNSIDKILRSV